MSRYFVISPKVEDDYSYYLDEMLANKTIMMGWGPDHWRGQMFDKMAIGDYVICAKGSNKNKQIYFAGKVTSDNTKEWPYTRQLSGFVDLREDGEIAFGIDNAFGSSAQPGAIYELKQHNEADRAICDIVKQKVEAQIKMEQINELKDVLKLNKNLILTGAPGTGKTYTAKKIAEAMGATDDNGKLGFVQFHPSYDYTDFIEGLRPIQDSQGNIGFKRRNGIFMDFCRDALADAQNNYVFIIDETTGASYRRYSANCSSPSTQVTVGRKGRW